MLARGGGKMNRCSKISLVIAVTVLVLELINFTKDTAHATKSDNDFQKELITELSNQFGQLKNELATDMVNLSKANKQYFMDFNEGNKEKLRQIVQALNEQTAVLNKTYALFRSDLIPVLESQSEETRKALLTELTKAHSQQISSLNSMDNNNKSLLEILKKSILVDEETKNLTTAIQLNIEGTNKNIDQTRKTIGILQEVLISRLKNMSQEAVGSEIRTQKYLADLRNKANVNISRNEEIKKAVVEIQIKEDKAQSYLSDNRNKANVNISRNEDILKGIKEIKTKMGLL